MPTRNMRVKTFIPSYCGLDLNIDNYVYRLDLTFNRTNSVSIAFWLAMPKNYVGISLKFAFCPNCAILQPMGIITTSLPWIQVILSVLIVGSVVLQQSAAGLGGALGGSDSGVSYHTRRGFEKFLFYFTIVLGILFLITGLVAVII